MDKESKDVELDKLLEEEMIREAEMIEKSLLGDRREDTPISEEEIDKSYARFLKRVKAEGLYREETQENSFKKEKEQEIVPETQSAEIVQFPGNRGKFVQDGGNGNTSEKSEDAISVVSFVQKNIQEEYLKNAQKEAEEKIPIAELQQMFDSSFKGLMKPRRNRGKAAGFAVLLALGILAGSMASQADKANFVSTIEYIINTNH